MQEGNVLTSPLAPAWSVECDGDACVLKLSGDWLARETGVRSDAELRQIGAGLRGVRRLRVDASRIGRWDSALVAFAAGLQAIATARKPGVELDLTGLPEPLRRLLALVNVEQRLAPTDQRPPPVSLLQLIGTFAISRWTNFVGATELIGASVLSVPAMVQGRLFARASDILTFTLDGGFGALGIVTIVCGLVGAILAFVGAVQLQRFGAEIYVTNLVGIAVVREMAPIMTAIVLAGRTGGAYAAQIATMEQNEEVDALQVLGVPVQQFIVMPRLIAAVTMTPLLCVYGWFAGLAGGMIVSVAMLDLSPILFLDHLRMAVPWPNFALGLTKSVCFGAYIALVGCRTGLAAGRSAAEVGRAATVAVVDGIIGVIALDGIFAAGAEIMGV